MDSNDTVGEILISLLKILSTSLYKCLSGHQKKSKIVQYFTNYIQNLYLIYSFVSKHSKQNSITAYMQNNFKIQTVSPNYNHITESLTPRIHYL